jgi:hypothetical protein
MLTSAKRGIQVTLVQRLRAAGGASQGPNIADDAADRINELEATVSQMKEAIYWALGERDDFPPEPEPLAGKYRQRYWWRTELRKRSGLPIGGITAETPPKYGTCPECGGMGGAHLTTCRHSPAFAAETGAKVCDNCGEALPKGCGGLFVDRGHCEGYVNDNGLARPKAETPAKPSYWVRTFWSPDKKHLVTVHVTSGEAVNIIGFQDDNGDEWEPASDQQNMEEGWICQACGRNNGRSLQCLNRECPSFAPKTSMETEPKP